MRKPIILPEDFTRRHALVALYALQDWECIRQPSNGPYAPRYFYNKAQGFLHGLANVSRTTVFKHLNERACFGCGAAIDLAHTTGDRLIPVADGGPESPQNTGLLCRRCNSSKGKKDLLQWWEDTERDPLALDRRVLCLYTRILWQHQSPAWLSAPCDSWAQGFLTARMASLPSWIHAEALIGASIAACAWGAAEQETLTGAREMSLADNGRRPDNGRARCL